MGWCSISSFLCYLEVRTAWMHRLMRTCKPKTEKFYLRHIKCIIVGPCTPVWNWWLGINILVSLWTACWSIYSPGAAEGRKECNNTWLQQCKLCHVMVMCHSRCVWKIRSGWSWGSRYNLCGRDSSEFLLIYGMWSLRIRISAKLHFTLYS